MTLHRRLVLPLLLALALAVPAVAVPAFVTPVSASPGVAAAKHDKAPRKKQKTRRTQPRSYGFLPGVRTPAQIERQRLEAWRRDERFARRYNVPRAYYYYYGPPYYSGRFGGNRSDTLRVGPCWTQTPIGPVWNCGK